MKEAAISLKRWMDKQALRLHERKEGRERIKIEWSKDWIMPLIVYENLIDQYSLEYFQRQLEYMVKYQKEFDEGKGKKGVDKPEAFLRNACKENYALTKI